MYVTTRPTSTLSGAGTVVSSLLLGPIGMLGSLATCKGNCDWRFPFNRAKREECKAVCEARREERQEDRAARREDDAAAPLPSTPFPILPVAVGVIGLVGAYLLLRNRKKS